jgi:ribosomal protein L7/L12
METSDLVPRIRAIEQQLKVISDHLGIDCPPFPGAAAVDMAKGGGVPPDVVALAAAGKKIHAIKRYREITGVGLKEAKDVVDAL